MFSKIFAIATIATLAAALPTPGGAPAGSCSTGPVQCCNQVGAANSAGIAKTLGLLGVVVQDVSAVVGLDCTSVDVLAITGQSCSAQSVCCENTQMNGLVNIGCNAL